MENYHRKKKSGEDIPEILYELLDQAKQKTMYDLMDEYSIDRNSTNDNSIQKNK